MATWYAKKMVCEWGMSSRMGMVEYGDHEDQGYSGSSTSAVRRGYRSGAHSRAGDRRGRCTRSSTGPYERGEEDPGRAPGRRVEKIAAALLEYETLDGARRWRRS
jgi:cell division protease FtsH